MFAPIAAIDTDVEASIILGSVPATGQIAKVEFIPSAAITGQNDDTRRVALTNRGTAGIGTAEAAVIQFDTGVDAVAFVPKSIPLSETVADLDVKEGDILTVDATAPGDGLALPAGTIVISISRTDA
jgi:hypothetical protein